MLASSSINMQNEQRLAISVRTRAISLAVCCGIVVAVLDAQERRLDRTSSSADRRVALVVGNDGYVTAPLRNARNDARDVGRTLEAIGFKVTVLQDATRQTLASALSTFGDGLQPNDVALFYFAGHGVQVDGENFLIPIDFRGQSASEAQLSGLAASNVQRLLQRARVSMLILDACRNNPYAGTRSLGGLAAMDPRGSLVAFATGAGQTAADAGAGQNGLFTQEFVKALAVPGLTAQQVFQQVRRAVYDSSAGRQFPAVYDGLLGDFVFRPAAVARPVVTPAAPPATRPDSELALRAELALWDEIKNSTNRELFVDFLAKYPSGVFSRAAKERIAKLGPGAATNTTPPATRPAAPALSSPSGLSVMSRDGRMRASGSGRDMSVVDARSNQLLWMGAFSAEITALAFTEEADLLIAGDRDGALNAIDVRTGTTAWYTSMPSSTPGPVTGITFSLDGKTFVAMVADKPAAVVETYSGKQVR